MNAYIHKTTGVIQIKPVPKDLDNWHTATVSSPADYVGKSFDPVAGAFVDPVVIPQSVTRRAAFLAMLEAGVLDDVIAWIESQSREVQIDFAEAQSFDVAHPAIEQAKAALGWTDDDVLGLFAIAGTK